MAGAIEAADLPYEFADAGQIGKRVTKSHQPRYGGNARRPLALVGAEVFFVYCEERVFARRVLAGQA